MKKSCFLFLIFIFVFSFAISSFAEDVIIDIEGNLMGEMELPLNPPADTLNKVSFELKIEDEVKQGRNFVLGLYSRDKATCFFEYYVEVFPWDEVVRFDIEVPPYMAGEKFFIKVLSENGSLKYGDAIGREFEFSTYSYMDEEGTIQYDSTFSGSFIPKEEINTNVYLDGRRLNYGIITMGDEVFVSEDILWAMRIDLVKEGVSYTLKSQNENLSMQFIQCRSEAYAEGKVYDFSLPFFLRGMDAYFPIKEVSEYFGCNFERLDTENSIEINIQPSVYGKSIPIEDEINSMDIESKTGYLIWIKKNDFTVNVFKGVKGAWRHYATYDCALGAKRSPTVEGQFEYIEYVERWSYASYYCGPVLRFYRGYALHSTLIRYNGTMYDDRVGANISLGCIRLHPEDINHLAEIIPLNTKIYITK